MDDDDLPGDDFVGDLGGVSLPSFDFAEAGVLDPAVLLAGLLVVLRVPLSATPVCPACVFFV